MKKQYACLSVLIILVFTVMMMGSRAYADDASQFNAQMKAIHIDRALMEKEMNLNPNWFIYPHASSYYDDLEDHYEQVMLEGDFIDKGIR